MDDTTGAIYVPTKSGLPFLVVTFADGAIQTQTAASRAEARAMLAGRTRRTPADGAARVGSAGSSKQ